MAALYEEYIDNFITDKKGENKVQENSRQLASGVTLLVKSIPIRIIIITIRHRELSRELCDFRVRKGINISHDQNKAGENIKLVK